jgi:hypothetical protein
MLLQALELEGVDLKNQGSTNTPQKEENSPRLSFQDLFAEKR